jgi:hypothetical protein
MVHLGTVFLSCRYVPFLSTASISFNSSSFLTDARSCVIISGLDKQSTKPLFLARSFNHDNLNRDDPFSLPSFAASSSDNEHNFVNNEHNSSSERDYDALFSTFLCSSSAVDILA